MLQTLKQIEEQLSDQFKLISKKDNIIEFLHIDSDIVYNFIPDGEYLMGLSATEEKAALAISDPLPFDPDNLRPAHLVKVQNCLITKTPIQNHQLARYIDWEYDPEDADSPANLTLQELEKLLSKIKMKIPSEQQWEYMCRAKTETLFTFGNSLPNDEELWKWLNCDFADLNQLKCNQFGFYGLFAGEWCSNNYTETYQKNENPTNEKVLRGGGSLFWPWQDEEWIWCTSSIRTHSEEDTSAAFRLVYTW